MKSMLMLWIGMATAALCLSSSLSAAETAGQAGAIGKDGAKTENIGKGEKGFSTTEGESEAPSGSYRPFKFKPLKKKEAFDEAPNENSNFVTGRQLFWSGRYDQAEPFFLEYLKENPDHEPTKIFLQMIHEARHFDPEKEKLVRQALEEVRFKHIEWKEVSLTDAIRYLREETKRQFPKGETVNFVNLIPETADIGKITLTASDANLAQLVEKIAQMAGIHHRVDSDGIVFEERARSI